jgi:hypothetical protein
MEKLISLGISEEDFDILLNNEIDLEFLAENLKIDEIKIFIG